MPRINNNYHLLGIIQLVLMAVVILEVLVLVFRNVPISKQGFVQVIASSGISAAGSQGGVSWHDYNSDGYLDLLARKQDTGYRLYRNNRDETFTDATREAGLPSFSYAHSAAFGDYDNDGCPDLYMADFSLGDKTIYPDMLFHNNCNGTFTDVSKQAGITNQYHSRGLAWGDYDRDGFLDLEISTFGVLKFIKNPTEWQLVDWIPEPNVIYHNNGNGTFTDVAKKVGITGLAACAKNKTEQYLILEKRNNHADSEMVLTGLLAKMKNNWQPAWFDYDNDGLPDLYISHETTINSLYHNNGDGTFTDVTERSGLCIKQSSHGVAIGDYDNDGYLDIYVTGSRHNMFWHNNHDGTFSEISEATGTGNAIFLGWGVGALDFDNDGNLDIYSINGTNENASVRYTYPSNLDRLYKNTGNGQFINVAGQEGIFGNDSKFTGAFGDYNNDGFVDIFIVSEAGLNQPSDLNRLYKNIPNGNHWLTIRLVGTKSNRDGIGARITLETKGKKQIREVASGGSLISQNSIWPTFGLDNYKTADILTIHWPSGKKQTLNNVRSDQILTIKEEK